MTHAPETGAIFRPHSLVFGAGYSYTINVWDESFWRLAIPIKQRHVAIASSSSVYFGKHKIKQQTVEICENKNVFRVQKGQHGTYNCYIIMNIVIANYYKQTM